MNVEIAADAQVHRYLLVAAALFSLRYSVLILSPTCTEVQLRARWAVF